MCAASRDTYHHGDLRSALLAAGRELLVERGPAGFSLNELSRRVGVSTAAPYRHFADRDALLDALADEGYAIFGAALRAAAQAAPDPRACLVGLGVAYLDFAAEHPDVFQLMFGDRAGRPAPAGPPTFEPLVAAVVQAQDAGVLPADQAVGDLARTIWATLHGLAVLDARGGLTKLGLGDSRDGLVRQAMSMLLGRV